LPFLLLKPDPYRSGFFVSICKRFIKNEKAALMVMRLLFILDYLEYYLFKNDIDLLIKWHPHF